jgi:hypothetical protein
VSVERTGSRNGLPYKVRPKHAGVHHARRFATATAAEKFDRKVMDLKAAGELHLLDEEPGGTITLRDYVHEVWWPDYAEVNLTDEGRDNYSVQLDLASFRNGAATSCATCARDRSNRGYPSCVNKASGTRRSSRR